jgi:hypothetical protein
MKKNVLNIFAVAAAAAALVSCNEAKFQTAQFVSFDGSKYAFSEKDGTVAIPVDVFGVDECTVAFTITDGTAKQGTDFTIVDKDGQPDNTGLVNVSSDKEKNDSIWVKLEHDTRLTKAGKSFVITLDHVATDGVVVGGTTQCSVSISDAEYAVSAYFGNFSNEDGSVAFDIEEYDLAADPDEIAEYYPDCCLKIPATSTAAIMGTAIAGDIYGYYSAADEAICLYAGQFYNAYNFSFGPGFVCLENSDDADEDVVLKTGEKCLIFATGATIGVYDYYTYERLGYYTKVPAETKLDKQ